ncbi:uncharacterized protein [Parasteatoda tepidariorum]|uniref:uncharacterized protein isoform X2 n=1 Tax=Parasteatoda tepidariorum TaxID=114398 RepID=UPI0039BD7FE9
MAIVNGCCCWRSLRSGSFAAGFYVLVLYTIILTAGVFQHFFNTITESPSTLIFTLVLIFFSVCCVISSVLLLVGLCVDSRTLMLPWLISVFSATLLDVLGALYLIIDSKYHEYLITLFIFDIIILGLNYSSHDCIDIVRFGYIEKILESILFCEYNLVYSLLCVFTHYKELCAGRGHPQVQINRSISLVEYPIENRTPSKKTPLVNDSGMTNSSTVSAANSSAFVIQSDAISKSATIGLKVSSDWKLDGRNV